MEALHLRRTKTCISDEMLLPSRTVLDRIDCRSAKPQVRRLFPNLVFLAFLGLWVLDRHVQASDAQRRSNAPPLALQQTDS